jgi:SAM-dependent methyltransferase
VVGIDISPKGIAQARSDARRRGIGNAEFRESTVEQVRGQFDVVMAVFFLHHLPDRALGALPGFVRGLLKPGGVFYSLDPSRARLSGRVGRVLVPRLMKKYQTEDERELHSEPTADLFRAAGFAAEVGMYDFGSTPLAGLFPGWAAGYRAARRVDDWVLRVPGVRGWGSNFEIVARG